MKNNNRNNLIGSSNFYLILSGMFFLFLLICFGLYVKALISPKSYLFGFVFNSAAVLFLVKRYSDMLFDQMARIKADEKNFLKQSSIDLSFGSAALVLSELNLKSTEEKCFKKEALKDDGEKSSLLIAKKQPQKETDSSLEVHCSEIHHRRHR